MSRGIRKIILAVIWLREDSCRALSFLAVGRYFWGRKKSLGCMWEWVEAGSCRERSSGRWRIPFFCHLQGSGGEAGLGAGRELLFGDESFGSLSSKFPREWEVPGGWLSRGDIWGALEREYGLGRARSSKLEESDVFGCCFLAEGRSHSLEQRTRERDLLSWRGASGRVFV